MLWCGRAVLGADDALADRVHPRRLDRAPQDRSAGGLEYGVEGTGEVRPEVVVQEPDVLEPLVEGEGEVTGLLHRPLAGWVGGDAAQMQPAGAPGACSGLTCAAESGVHPWPGCTATPRGEVPWVWRPEAVSAALEPVEAVEDEVERVRELGGVIAWSQGAVVGDREGHLHDVGMGSA